MSFAERDLLNRLLVLSAAITEMLELETQMVAEFRQCRDELAGRREYLSFWLRSQSFFITAKSLTDSEHFQSNYARRTSSHWRLGTKALRNFFAHEIGVIPSLHSAVRFIPEERVSVSLRGFVINLSDAKGILKECVKGDFRKELHRKSKAGKVRGSLTEIKKIYRKYRDKKFKALNDWKSKPNQEVVVITDIATKHYIEIYELFGVFLDSKGDDRCEAEKSCSGIVSIETKLQSIEDTVDQVKAYRSDNFKWRDCVSEK